MGIFKSIKNSFSLSKAEINYDDKEAISSFFGRSSKTITPHNAQKLSTVFACINLRANAIAVMGIKTYKRTENGKKEDYTNPLYNLLRYEPNATLTASLYKKMISQDIDLFGNHYSQVQYNGLGKVVALYPLVANKMSVTFDSNNKRVYTYDGKVVSSKRILHIYDIPDAQGLKGLSRIEYARQELEFADNASSHGNKIFKNSTTPSGAFETDQTLNDESYKRLKNDIVDKYTGQENAGTPLLLEGGLTFKPLSLKNSDAEWLASRNFNREQICNFFGVPVSMVNDPTATAYGNLEQQFMSFFSNTIFPLTTIIEEQLRQSLLKQEEKATTSIKFKYNTMLRVDAQTRANYYQTRFNIGSISPNEIRAYEDENGFEGGDEKYVQLNLSTVQNLNKGEAE